MLKIYGRLLLFFGYTSLFTIIPLWLLGGGLGAVGVGIAFNIFFLWLIGQKGREKALDSLQANPLLEENFPGPFNITRFYSEKFCVQQPELLITSVPLMNLCLFGTKRNSSLLVLSEELLHSLTREQLGAVICRAITSIASGQSLATSWLSCFLSFVECLARRPLLKLITYPLAFFPIRLLSNVFSEQRLDSSSLQMCRSPHSLLPALQRIRSAGNESAWPVPASLSLLFVIPPLATDPLAQVLWLPDESKPRIVKLKEAFYHS